MDEIIAINREATYSIAKFIDSHQVMIAQYFFFTRSERNSKASSPAMSQIVSLGQC